jgi:hypothetical protein
LVLLGTGALGPAGAAGTAQVQRGATAPGGAPLAAMPVAAGPGGAAAAAAARAHGALMLLALGVLLPAGALLPAVPAGALPVSLQHAVRRWAPRLSLGLKAAAAALFLVSFAVALGVARPAVAAAGGTPGVGGRAEALRRGHLGLGVLALLAVATMAAAAAAHTLLPAPKCSSAGGDGLEGKGRLAAAARRAGAGATAVALLLGERVCLCQGPSGIVTRIQRLCQAFDSDCLHAPPAPLSHTSTRAPAQA